MLPSSISEETRFFHHNILHSRPHGAVLTVNRGANDDPHAYSLLRVGLFGSLMICHSCIEYQLLPSVVRLRRDYGLPVLPIGLYAAKTLHSLPVYGR